MGSPHIQLTGPLLIGTFLSYFLCGCYWMQLYVYYCNSMRSDRKQFLFLVSLVTTLEIVHLVFISHTAYFWLADGFGDVERLGQTPWSGSVLPALNGFVAFLTQVFFAWRIRRLADNRWGDAYAVLICLLAATQCMAAIAGTYQILTMGMSIETIMRLHKTVIVWLGGSVVCDVGMTVGIIFILVHYKKLTVYNASRNLLDRLIAHSIENGVVTAVGALIVLIFYLALPNNANYLYIAAEFVLGRLYANVLMATLNRRKRLKGGELTDVDPSIHSSRFRSNSSNELESVRFRIPLSQTTGVCQCGAMDRATTTTIDGVQYPMLPVTRRVEIGCGKGAEGDLDGDEEDDDPELGMRGKAAGEDTKKSKDSEMTLSVSS